MTVLQSLCGSLSALSSADERFTGGETKLPISSTELYPAICTSTLSMSELLNGLVVSIQL